MTFTEAMNLCASNPAGPGVVAVSRPDKLPRFIFWSPKIVFEDQPIGFLVARSRNDHNSGPYEPSIDDINATDWEVITL